MSIERLNKAASAAGFAMATPDDDAVTETAPEAEAPPSRAVAIVEQAPRPSAVETLHGLTGWLKGHLPAIGWRQPA